MMRIFALVGLVAATPGWAASPAVVVDDTATYGRRASTGSASYDPHDAARASPVVKKGDNPFEDDIKGLTPDDDTANFFSRVFPLVVDSPLDPLVDDNMWPFFFGGALFCVGGNIWLPALFVGGSPPDGYWSDALLAWGLHIVALLGFTVLMSIVSVVINPLAAVTGSITIIALLAAAFYFTPVAAINSYNRALLKQRRAEAPPRRRAPQPPPPPPPIDDGRPRDRTPYPPDDDPYPLPEEIPTFDPLDGPEPALLF